VVNTMSVHEYSVEILSKAIDVLFITRSQLAEFKTVDGVILDEAIDRSVLAMVLCLDLKHKRLEL
jgi:hypothetical protein